MIPNTLVGLIVFAAAAGPGYLYVRLTKLRAPRAAPTALEEAVEFVVVGALSSSVAVLLALAFGEWSNLIEPSDLADHPGRYAVDEPLRSLGALSVALAISYGVVWFVTTQLIHRGKATIGPGESSWYAVFRRMLPDRRGVYVTAELRDGRAVAGLAIAYTVDDRGPRELVLSAPVNGTLWERTKDGAAIQLPDTFMVLQGDDVLSVSGRYTELGPALEPQKRRWWRR